MSSNKNRSKGSKASRSTSTGSSKFIGFSAFANTNTTVSTTLQATSTATSSAAATTNKSDNKSHTSGANLIKPSPIWYYQSKDNNNNFEQIDTLFKKIGKKKDTVTKSKALSELSVYFSSSANKKEQIAILCHLVFLFYTKLGYDNDKNVRCGVLECFAKACESIPKAFYVLITQKSFFKLPSGSNAKCNDDDDDVQQSVLGMIYSMQKDGCAEVETLASQIIQSLFQYHQNNVKDTSDTSDKESKDLTTTCMKHLFNLLKHANRPSSTLYAYSSVSTSLSNNNKNNSNQKKKKKQAPSSGETAANKQEEEKQQQIETHERVVISCLRSLSFLIFGATTTEQIQLVSQYLTSRSKYISQVMNKFLTNSNKHIFRREAYHFYSALFSFAKNNMSDDKNSNYIQDIENENITSKMLDSVLTQTQFYSLLTSEKEPMNFSSVFEIVLFYFSSLSNDNENKQNIAVDYNRIVKSIQKLFRPRNTKSNNNISSMMATQWGPFILPLVAHLIKVAEADDGNNNSVSTGEEILKWPLMILSTLSELVLNSGGNNNIVLSSSPDKVALVYAIAETCAFLLLRKSASISSSSVSSGQNQQEGKKRECEKICDLFNACLNYYLYIPVSASNTTGTSSTSSSSVDQLCKALARDLSKMDTVAKNIGKSTPSSSCFFEQCIKYQFGSMEESPTPKTKNNDDCGTIQEIITNAINASFPTQNKVLYSNVAQRLHLLLYNTMKNQSSQQEQQNHNMSSLLNPLKIVFDTVLTNSHTTRVITLEESNLLMSILDLFGVSPVLCTKRTSAESESESSNKNLLENFLVNHMLKWILILDRRASNDNKEKSVSTALISSPSSKNSRIISNCFRMFYKCLKDSSSSSSSSTSYQQKLWETFFTQLLKGKIDLNTISCAFQILIDDENIEENEESMLDVVKYSKAVSEFCMQIGEDTSNLYKYGLLHKVHKYNYIDIHSLSRPVTILELNNEGEEKTQEIFEAEKKVEWIEEEIKHLFRKLKTFFNVVTRKDEENKMIVSQRVVSYWISTVLSSIKEDPDQTFEPLQHDENDANVLLGVLIKIASSGDMISEEDTVKLHIEAWHQTSNIWNTSIDHSLLKKNTQFYKEATDILQRELLKNSSVHHENKVMLFSDSQKWSQRAWKLLCIPPHAATTSFQSVLTTTGLNQESLLRQVVKETDDTSSRREWLFWCLSNIFSKLSSKDLKCLVLDTNEKEQNAKWLIDTLLFLVSGCEENEKESLIANDQVKHTLDLLFGYFDLDNNESNDETEHENDSFFLEDCCIKLIRYLSSSSVNNVSFGSLYVLDTLLKMLFGSVKAKRITPVKPDEKLELSLNQDKTVIESLTNITPNDVNVSDVYWYKQKYISSEVENQDDEEKHRFVKAEIVKIHTDDFPNLYFTIKAPKPIALASEKEGEMSLVEIEERQTVSSRLFLIPKKTECQEKDSYSIILPESQSIFQRQRSIEELVFNSLIKTKNSDISPEKVAFLTHSIIQHCGLHETQLVGLTSIRYQIKQSLYGYEQSIIQSLSSKKEGDIRTAASNLHYLSLAMMSSLNSDSSADTQFMPTNFQIMDFSVQNIMKALCDFYEQHQNDNETDNANGENVDVGLALVDLSSAVLFWLCVSMETLLTTQTQRDMVIQILLNSSFVLLPKVSSSFMVLKIASIIQDHLPKIELPKDSLHGCVQYLIDYFVSDVNNKNSSTDANDSFLHLFWLDPKYSTTNCWYDPFSSFLSKSLSMKPRDRSFSSDKDPILCNIIDASIPHLNELCSLLIVNKNDSSSSSSSTSFKCFCSFYLLHLVAAHKKKIPLDDDKLSENLNPSSQKLLENLVSQNAGKMGDEELRELVQDFNLTSTLLPSELMLNIESLSKFSLDGQLLTWLTVLDFLESAGIQDSRNRNAISSYVSATGAVNTILNNSLQEAIRSLKQSASLQESGEGASWRIHSLSPETLNSMDPSEVTSKATILVFFRTFRK